jgi:hypothetical protein
MGGTIRQHCGNGGLKACCNIFRPRLPLGDRARHSGFEAGEGKITPRPAQKRPRQVHPSGIATAGHAFQMRPARPRQTQKLRGFVKSFPHRIIKRAAQAAVAAKPFHQHALAMPAGKQQQKIGECRHPARHQAWQAHCQCMGFQVIDGDERQAMGQRHALGEGSPHDQSTDEPGTRCCRDRIKRRIADAGLGHDARHKPRQMLQMRPRGNFRHHAAKGCVFLQLAKDGLSQNGAIRAQYSRGGFIAAALNPQDDGIRLHAKPDTMPGQ